MNLILQNLDLTYLDGYAISIDYLKHQKDEFHEMQKITNDFTTFIKFGYTYRQVNNIHDFMLNSLSKYFAYIWRKAYACQPENYVELLTETKNLYQKCASDFQTLCKIYEEHSKYGLKGEALVKAYPLARDKY